MYLSTYICTVLLSGQTAAAIGKVVTTVGSLANLYLYSREEDLSSIFLVVTKMSIAALLEAQDDERLEYPDRQTSKHKEANERHPTSSYSLLQPRRCSQRRDQAEAPKEQNKIYTHRKLCVRLAQREWQSRLRPYGEPWPSRGPRCKPSRPRLVILPSSTSGSTFSAVSRQCSSRS